MSENNTRKLRRVDRRSVVERWPVPNQNNPTPTRDNSQTFWFLSNFVDDIIPWGQNPKARDKQLRNFILQENIFASALGIICSRNAGFSWRLDGPPRTASRMQDIFDMANMGEGWHDLIIKVSMDLYTQDNGAFIEIVREENNQFAPIIGINHLDSAQCWHTGAPEAPVIYMDRFGKAHLLPWYSVITLAEMPVPIERLYGLQYSALSRMLRGAQIQKNISIYDNEKTSGRNTRAIHLVKGITTQQLADAMLQAKAEADSAGLMRYINPIAIGTIDPRADVGHDTIDLVGMPENWDSEEAFKQYINLISMAFESDYQEFAPLPGGGLGTGNQSEILHLKNRGKGPGLFMKLITHAINFRILPTNIRFFFDEQDLEAEKSEAEVKAIRAQTRKTRIESFEISPEIARQIANDEGDLDQEFLDVLGEQDISTDQIINDDAHPKPPQPRVRARNPLSVARPDPNLSTSRTPNPTASRPRQPQKD